MKSKTTCTATDERAQSTVWTDGLGRRAGEVYFDSLGHRRVVTPPEHYDDAGNLVATGAEAGAAMLAHFTEQQASRQTVLRKMPPKVRREYATYLRTGRLPEVRAHAPREARNDRPRGSRRSSVRRSSERSGDSGDGEGSEPPERLCACGCDLDISHRAPQARYLNDTHAAFARQRRKRTRARDWNPDVSRRDSYFQFDEPTYEQLRQRVEQGCRCNGGYFPDPADSHCLKCGHRRGWALPSAKSIPARSAETRRPRETAVLA